MTVSGSDKNAAEGAPAVMDRVRWRRAASSSNRKRFQIIAFACVTLTTLAAVLFSLSTLVSPKPNTVLVSLYQLPPIDETLGTNAPFHPLSDRLFDLTPSNVEVIKQDAPQTDPSKQNQTLPIEYRLTDWSSAVERLAKSEELVLQVSSLARVEHDQVIFFGRDAEATLRVSFSDLLATVGRSPAKKSLIVLDVGWPMVSDSGDSRPRIEQLERLIRQEFARSTPRGCQLLIATAGPKSVSGIANEPRSLLSRALSAAIESPESDTNHDGRTSVGEAVDWVSKFANSQIHGRRLPTLSLIGSGDNFGFRKTVSPEAVAQRAYPDSLAASWQRRNQYMRSLEIPFLSETAAGWWTGLNDLESRWLRGEPLASIDRDVMRLERRCVKEILDALEHSRARRSDSLTSAARRFPLDSVEAATRWAVELISRQSESFATTEAGRDAISKKLVAEYVAKFKPEDAALVRVHFAVCRAMQHGRTVETRRLAC
jgi:hypothetical protein